MTHVTTCIPTLLAYLLLSTGFGCDKSKDTPEAASRSFPAADNTDRNERDRNNTVTPIDQGNNTDDLDTTQRIRRALMDDESLSAVAKNTKIVTANGVVTLRGPVESAAERTSIENAAREASGKNRVDNQLEIIAGN